MKKTHVVYKITNIKTNGIYIGLTSNFERRMAQHKRVPNKKMQLDIVDDSFYATYTTEIIFKGTESECCNKEIELIDSLDPIYNTLRGGYGFNSHSGEKAPTSIFSNKEVYEIRMLFAYADDYDLRIISDIYGVCVGTISNITRGKTYPKAKGPIIENGQPIKITDSEVIELRIRAKNGEIGSDLANYYNLSHAQTYRIILGERRPNVGGPIKWIDYSGNYKNTQYTVQQIIEMREVCYTSTKLYSELSLELGIAPGQLAKLAKGITFKDVPGKILGKDYMYRGEGKKDSSPPLSENDVINIRDRGYKTVDTYEVIAQNYPITATQVGNIIKGDSWGLLPGKILKKDYKSRGEGAPDFINSKEDMVVLLREYAKINTDSYSSMSKIEKFKCFSSSTNISRIVRGERWKAASGPILGKDYMKRGEGAL